MKLNFIFEEVSTDVGVLEPKLNQRNGLSTLEE